MGAVSKYQILTQHLGLFAGMNNLMSPATFLQQQCWLLRFMNCVAIQCPIHKVAAISPIE